MTKPQIARALELASPEDLARALAAKRKTHAGGAPRSNAARCPCGEMTLKRAKARGHKCDA